MSGERERLRGLVALVRIGFLVRVNGERAQPNDVKGDARRLLWAILGAPDTEAAVAALSQPEGVPDERPDDLRAALRKAAERVVEEYDKTHLTHDVAYEDVAAEIDQLRLVLLGRDHPGLRPEYRAALSQQSEKP